MSVSHEHFNFWFVEIGADFDQLLKLSNLINSHNLVIISGLQWVSVEYPL